MYRLHRVGMCCFHVGLDERIFFFKYLVSKNSIHGFFIIRLKSLHIEAENPPIKPILRIYQVRKVLFKLFQESITISSAQWVFQGILVMIIQITSPGNFFITFIEKNACIDSNKKIVFFFSKSVLRTKRSFILYISQVAEFAKKKEIKSNNDFWRRRKKKYSPLHQIVWRLLLTNLRTAVSLLRRRYRGENNSNSHRSHSAKQLPDFPIVNVYPGFPFPFPENTW